MIAGNPGPQKGVRGKAPTPKEKPEPQMRRISVLPAGGQSPALQALGMRCWRPETGRVAGRGWMLRRETITRIVENILSIFTEVLSLILTLSRPDRKTLHDMVAGTVVCTTRLATTGSRIGTRPTDAAARSTR
jgi:uncharacterized RDD family membrane protein YckC